MSKFLQGIKPGKLFAVSAPSGTGKTSLVNELTKRIPFLVESVSYTTRPPRKNEIEGKDYYFVSRTIFKEKIEKNYFVEWAEVFGNFYGTSKNIIEKELDSGNFIICDIDIQGALNLQKKFPLETVLIFILPPSFEELEKRLTSRDTDDNETIKKRLEEARHEMRYFKNYNHLIINDNFEDAVKSLERTVNLWMETSISSHCDLLESFFN